MSGIKIFSSVCILNSQGRTTSLVFSSPSLVVLGIPTWGPDLEPNEILSLNNEAHFKVSSQRGIPLNLGDAHLDSISKGSGGLKDALSSPLSLFPSKDGQCHFSLSVRSSAGDQGYGWAIVNQVGVSPMISLDLLPPRFCGEENSPRGRKYLFLFQQVLSLPSEKAKQDLP